MFFILSIEGFGYDSQIKLFDEMKKMKDMTKSDENQSNAKSKLAINSTNSNLFLVCYHLPITIKRTGKKVYMYASLSGVFSLNVTIFLYRKT